MYQGRTKRLCHRKIEITSIDYFTDYPSFAGSITRRPKIYITLHPHTETCHKIYTNIHVALFLLQARYPLETKPHSAKPRTMTAPVKYILRFRAGQQAGHFVYDNTPRTHLLSESRPGDPLPRLEEGLTVRNAPLPILSIPLSMRRSSSRTPRLVLLRFCPCFDLFTSSSSSPLHFLPSLPFSCLSPSPSSPSSSCGESPSSVIVSASSPGSRLKSGDANNDVDWSLELWGKYYNKHKQIEKVTPTIKHGTGWR